MSTLAKSILPYKIDIVLVTWNRWQLTDKVINSIVQNTHPENYRLIVIDNGSNDGTDVRLHTWFTNGKIDSLVLNKENLGLEPARNQGLGMVTSQYFVCVDNDLLCPPPLNGEDWLFRMHKLLVLYPEYGALSMRTQVMIGTGNIFDGQEDRDVVQFPHPGGSYRIMRTDVVKKVGGWRNDVNSRGSEEKHICSKLQNWGYKTGFAVQVKSLHLHGDQSTDGWGYPKDWKPEDSGHTEVWHPILVNGDNPEQIKHFQETGQYE